MVIELILCMGLVIFGFMATIYFETLDKIREDYRDLKEHFNNLTNIISSFCSIQNNKIHKENITNITVPIDLEKVTKTIVEKIKKENEENERNSSSTI